MPCIISTMNDLILSRSTHNSRRINGERIVYWQSVSCVLKRGLLLLSSYGHFILWVISDDVITISYDIPGLKGLEVKEAQEL